MKHLLALGFGFILVIAPCEAATRFTITVDGDLSDWTGVLIDPENAISDAPEFAGDLDNPGADRDLRGFAWTWDDTDLYFWWRRTLSGTNTISFYVYMDLDFDGYMSSQDVVARYRFSGETFQTAELHYYSDGGDPDPITGDGDRMPGGLGAQIPAVMTGAGALSGVQLEASVRWADLGVPPGTPMRFHISAGNNNNIQDNMEAFDSLYGGIEFTSAQRSVTAPGSLVFLQHTIRNTGNADDTFDILVQATQAWDHLLYSDPDGDGDPLDGELMAMDANGDGDYDDPFDTAPPLQYDADKNGVPDTGVLAPGEASSFLVAVRPPDSTANGTIDDVVLWVRSANVPAVQETLRDQVTVGSLVVSPDYSVPVQAGNDVDFAHSICNQTPVTGAVELTTSSLEGWAVTLYSDPNGDGDPSDGQPLTDSSGDTLPDVPVVAGTCVPFVARVSVPGIVPVGQQDTHQVLANAPLLGLADVLYDVTTVADAVTVEPEYSQSTPVGGTIYYAHSLTNALPRDEIFDLRAFSSLGSTVEIYADADRDGIPDSEVPISDTGPVPALGGTFSFVVGETVPVTAPHASFDQLDVQVTAQSDPLIQDIASNTTMVRNMLTFSDPLFARPSTTFFAACADIYAEASGLPVNEDYRFVWADPNGADGDDRITPIREPDADGLVDDVYVHQAGDLSGDWHVRIQQRAGSNWVNLGVGGGRAFEVLPGGGVIESLAPGKEGFYIAGESVAVNLALRNPTDIDFIETVVQYVVFEDGDSDGDPSPGEWYIQSNGTAAPWAPGEVTWWTSPVHVYRGEEFHDFWRVTGVQFPTSGTWTVQSSWLMDCGDVIDRMNVPISTCAVLPPVDAGPDGAVCRGTPTTIGSPERPGYSYRWYPADDLDYDDVAQPVVTLQQHRTYSMVMVEDATGCSDTDTLSLTLVDPPVPDILPDGPVIPMGGNVVLDAGPGDAWLWTTNPAGGPGEGATTRTIDVTPGNTTTYSVTVWGSSGCFGTTDEMVTVMAPPPAPVVQPDGSLICQGAQVVLDAGVDTDSYVWTTSPPGEPGDGATTRTIQVAPSQTTSYSVRAIDGWGQEGSDAVVIEVLTTTPGSVGNTLRVRRSGNDVTLSWTGIPNAWTYNLYRSGSGDYASPVYIGQSAGLTDYTDTGAVNGQALYLYQTHGFACFEGPR